MERFRSEGYFIAAKKEAMAKGVEAKELDSDEVVLEAAYKKALATETDQIQMDDFAKVVDPELMKKHKKEVAGLKGLFDKQKENPKNRETIMLGKILEAIVTEQIELNDWLGSNVNTQQTTDYDDFMNGIDFVAEMNEDGASRHMGFAIDATHGAKKTIRMKLEKIRSQLNHGELGEVFYFQSLDKSFQGRKRFIPRIVLALDKKHVAEIARLWVRGEQTALSQHPVKEMILREIVTQLEGQLTYAHALEKANKENASLMVDVLSGQLDAMKRLHALSGRELMPGEKSFNDKGAETIRNGVASVFAPENVDQIEELELKLKIKKRKKTGADISALKRQYQGLMERKQGRSLGDRQVEESTEGKRTKEKVEPNAVLRAELYDELQALLQQRVNGVASDDLMREMRLVQNKLQQLDRAERDATPWAAEGREPTFDELKERYKELLRRRTEGDKLVIPELKQIEKILADLRKAHQAELAKEQDAKLAASFGGLSMNELRNRLKKIQNAPQKDAQARKEIMIINAKIHDLRILENTQSGLEEKMDTEQIDQADPARKKEIAQTWASRHKELTARAAELIRKRKAGDLTVLSEMKEIQEEMEQHQIETNPGELNTMMLAAMTPEILKEKNNELIHRRVTGDRTASLVSDMILINKEFQRRKELKRIENLAIAQEQAERAAQIQTLHQPEQKLAA